MASRFRTCSLLLLIVVTFSLSTFAQDDSDPNSPLPVLVTGSDETRVLAVDARGWNGNVPERGPVVFQPSDQTTVVIFVRGLDLMPGENINALRVFVQQRTGKTFEMETIVLTQPAKNTHAITFRLFDRSGYRGTAES